MKKKDTFEEILGGILMAVIFLCATFQVLNRFMLHFSAPWTEELCRYAFIWVAFLGVANGVKRGTHLNVDLIDSVLPKKVKAVLDVVLDAAFLLLMAYMLKISIDYLMRVARYGTVSVGLKIPMWIVYSILPLFTTLTMVRLVEKYVRKLINRKKREGEK